MDRFLRGALVGVVALSLPGCKSHEPEFVEDYLSAFCGYYVDCTDPALEVFDGELTIEACRAEFGPEVAARAQGCKLSKKAAEACIEEMASVSCPTDGSAPEEALPASCEVAWKKCKDVSGEVVDEQASG